MISEKTKLKLLDKSTQDLIEVKTLIDNELDKRYDNEIAPVELQYGFNTIYRQMIKEGSV